MSGDSWELLGSSARQPDWGDEPEPAKQETAPSGMFSWISRDDRPAAAEFAASHKHGEIVHARTWDGHHLLGCRECGEAQFVDVVLSTERFDGLPRWPFPKAELDLAATVAELADRITRLERA